MAASGVRHGPGYRFKAVAISDDAYRPLMRQFGGISHEGYRRGAERFDFLRHDAREFRMIRLRGIRHRYQSESCPFRDDMARRLRKRGALECRQGAGVSRTLYPPTIPNRTSELFHLSCS
jgi:hypothetical protein